MNVPRSDSLPSVWGIVFPHPLNPANSRRLLALLRTQFRKQGPTPLLQEKAQLLTRRQQEVLRELVGGKGTKALARALGMSQKTAETHRQNLMKRLGIHDVPGLVRYALHAGVVPPGWLSGGP